MFYKFLLGPCLILMATALNSFSIESPDIFVGPFSHWINVKNAPYNAVGNGTTDDRSALQAALNAVQSTGKNGVIYLPAGTYRITNKLTLQCTENVRIVGAHPDSVTIKFDGATGIDMMYFTGCAGVRIGRLTLEGSSKAKCGMVVTCDYSLTGNLFPSGWELHDIKFKNMNTGLQGGGSGNGPLPEATVIRCQFTNCGMGVNVVDFNTADVWIRHCTFASCSTGVANSCGETQVYNCIFRNSLITDVSQSTFGMSVRHCYSINSKKFYSASGGGDGFVVILDGNTIIDPTNNIPIDASNSGPHVLFDNVIRTAAGAASISNIRLGGLSEANLLVNNTLTSGNASNTIRNSSGTAINVGRIIDLHFVDPSTVNATEPVLPSTPSRSTGTIIEPTARTGAAIQTAITDAATNHPNDLTVIYLRMGADYLVSSTIIIPKNVKIWLMGDLFGNAAYPTTGASRILWNGTGAGPVIKLMGASKATISDLYISGGDKAQGILVDNADQQNGRVFLEHVSTGEGVDGIGCLVDTVDWTRVEAWDYRVMAQAGLGISTRVVGGPLTASGQATTGCMNIWGCNVMLMAAASATANSGWDILNGGRLMANDNWGEANPRQPYIKFTSTNSGTFTTQGYKIQYHTNGLGTTPTMIFSGFTGKATVLGLSMANSVVDISGSNAGQNVLYAGVDFGHNGGSSPPSTSTISTTIGKTALINCTYDMPNNQICSPYDANNTTCYSHTGSTMKPDSGNSINDTVWIRQMMAQAQSNHPMVDLNPTPGGATDVKLIRVSPNHTKIAAIQIKGCPTCVQSVIGRQAVNMFGMMNGSKIFKMVMVGESFVVPDDATKITLFDCRGRISGEYDVSTMQDRYTVSRIISKKIGNSVMMVKVDR